MIVKYLEMSHWKGISSKFDGIPCVWLITHQALPKAIRVIIWKWVTTLAKFKGWRNTLPISHLQILSTESSVKSNIAMTISSDMSSLRYKVPQFSLSPRPQRLNNWSELLLCNQSGSSASFAFKKIFPVGQGSDLKSKKHKGVWGKIFGKER